MEIRITSAATKQCAGCAGDLRQGVGSVVAIVGDKEYHLSCTPEAIENARWLYHSKECPTCKGRGRISDKAS